MSDIELFGFLFFGSLTVLGGAAHLVDMLRWRS